MLPTTFFNDTAHVSMNRFCVPARGEAEAPAMESVGAIRGQPTIQLDRRGVVDLLEGHTIIRQNPWLRSEHGLARPRFHAEEPVPCPT